MRPSIASYSRIWLGLPPSAGAAWTSILKSLGAPSAPPTTTSLPLGFLSIACIPPRRTPGVCVVRLPTKRCVATSVIFTVMSRLAVNSDLPSPENTVPRIQSSWAAM